MGVLSFERMANRLAAETSPYLLQHRDNPVDWYPWGEEALARARAEDLPILLSVGYSACHWCHVMERESFEDAATAAYMNAHFVCVKVDREERPDVDAIYMEAVQAFTGQGGWPMTVFLDPDGVPFFGGTYFPPDELARDAELPHGDGSGARGFSRQARGNPRAGGDDDGADSRRSAEACPRWGPRRGRARGRGDGAPRPRRPGERRLRPGAEVPARLLARAAHGRGVRTAEDGGGLGHVERTLDAMLAGGIYDQLGGGFARYSVDAAWLVPHFEKMLYDNGLLARAYLHGWQVLGHERYRRVCEETLDWMLREMRGPEGGFYSAYDADSEGEEGRFYVWTPEEIRAALKAARRGRLTAAPGAVDLTGDIGGKGRPHREPPPDANEILAYFGVTEAGNFEGRNILHLADGAAAPVPAGLDAARAALLAARAERVWPGLDDKRLASWNALAIGGARRGGRRARPRRLPARRRRPAPSSSSAPCATTTAACCAPTRTAAPT